jgi:hypothetical protein
MSRYCTSCLIDTCCECYHVSIVTRRLICSFQMKLSFNRVWIATWYNRMSMRKAPFVDDLYAIIYMRLIHSSSSKSVVQSFVCSIDGLLHSDNNSKIGQCSRAIQYYIFGTIPITRTRGYGTTNSKIGCSLLRDNIANWSILETDLTVEHVRLFIAPVFIGVACNEKASSQHVFKKMNRLTIVIIALDVSSIVIALSIIVLVRLFDESIYNE